MNYIFPSNFVYWEKIPNHQKIKKTILNTIDDDIKKNEFFYREKLKENWKCKCISNFFNKDNNFYETLSNKDFIKSIIWNPIDNMLKEMRDTVNLPIPEHSEIVNLWFNRYGPGEWQEIHEHSPVMNKSFITYSGIYLLDLNEKNPTIFFDKIPARCWGNECLWKNFSTEHMDEGTVIIFPAELLHYVNPCVNYRTTISFNIKSIFR